MLEVTNFEHWKVRYTEDDIAEIHTVLAHIPYLSILAKALLILHYYIATQRKRNIHIYRVVDRQRKVLIHEADFNVNNNIMGMRMMKNVELNDLLALEQYESRKRRNMRECALNKRLMFDE